MTLYEPIAMTFILITVLSLALSGELFDVFLTKHERDCHTSNERLLNERMEGPLRECR